MSGAELKSIIEQGIANLFGRYPKLLEFTAQTGQTEWNLGHHMAVELGALLPAFDCDMEVLKRGHGYGNRRPDIIFHKRGDHRSNFLVIELKRDGKPKDAKADVKKIQRHWFRGPLRYQFGAAVNLRSDGKHEVQVFENRVRAPQAEVGEDLS